MSRVHTTNGVSATIWSSFTRRKYSIAFFLLAASNAALAAPQKVGDFDLKRYSDEKNIVKILLSNLELLGDPACVSAVLDSQAHQALLSSGRYIQAISLKTAKEDEEAVFVLTFEYASIRPKEVGIVKKTLKCPFLEREEHMEKSNESGF